MDSRRLAIRAVVDRARTREWHRQAIDTLRANGHHVHIAVASNSRPFPPVLSALLALERLTSRRAAGSPSDFGGAWDAVETTEPSGFRPDLILDLTNGVAQAAPVRTLRILYSGSVSEEYGLLCLLNGRAPVLGITDSMAPGRVCSRHVAIESTFRLTHAMDSLYRRLKDCLVQAVAAVAAGAPVASEPVPGPDPLTGWTAGQTLAALQARAASVIKRLTLRHPHWYVGWRRVDGEGLRDSLAIPHGGWNRLPDDGRRFYADPFPARHAGRDWVFVEEFPYATGKGILSVVEIGSSGPLGAPRPVMESAHHLSYPCVFEDNGSFWMIPESCAARRVELYRATAFPFSWDLAGVLIDGEALSDATIVKHGARCYLFGTSSDSGRSSWDALKIWSAPNLLGPWTAVSDEPVLIDARAARPAGHFFVRNGELWRPAQDCSTGYGAALVFARVDRLDAHGFSQSVQAVLRPNADWPGIGFHTHNVSNGIETVDGCAG